MEFEEKYDNRKVVMDGRTMKYMIKMILDLNGFLFFRDLNSLKWVLMILVNGFSNWFCIYSWENYKSGGKADNFGFNIVVYKD